MIGDPHFPVIAIATAAVIVVLAVFTAIGWILQARAKTPASRDTAANFNARVRSWWAMVAVFGAAIVLGRHATLVLFAVISFLALREFISLTPTRRGDHRVLFVAFFIVVPLQYALIWINWYGLFSIFIPVYVFLILPALAVMAGDTQDFLARTAKVQWGLMLSVYAISYAAAVLLLDVRGYTLPNALLLLYLIVVVQLSDVFQYVFGKMLGRTPLAPTVSPKKTVEGLVGGGLTAIGIGTALYPMTPFAPWQAALVSAVIVLGGFFGGLVLSAIKRDLGVKDWGRMIEGHGGVLDRVDSVSFAAPLFFHVTRYWFAN